MLEAAAARRDVLFGRALTFSPKVFLPLTNLCRNHCEYCSFRRSPGDPGEHTMSPSELRERFDVIVLASDAIDRLLSAGCGLAGSRVDLVHSGVAVAVQSGPAAPDIGTEAALRRAVLAAPTIGHSTGPSGVQLLKLFERWGILAELQGRIHQAPPGVPVGALVAQGQVALGFQQLSELIHLPGITVIGPLPDAVQINTTFSACTGAACSQPDAVRALLAFLTSPQAQDAQRRHGMVPA